MTATSATGRLDRPRDGFTLVELLTAVVILGLCGAMAVLAMPDPSPGLAAEAQGLAATIVRGREEAVLTNRVARLTVDASGYAVRLDGAPSPALAQASWVEGDVVLVTGADGATVSQATLTLDPTGVADPATVSLVRGDRRIAVRIDQAAQVSVDAAR